MLRQEGILSALEIMDLSANFIMPVGPSVTLNPIALQDYLH